MRPSAGGRVSHMVASGTPWQHRRSVEGFAFAFAFAYCMLLAFLFCALRPVSREGFVCRTHAAHAETLRPAATREIS